MPRDRQPAPGLPVARVCVDVPLPHLDRPFDYLVDADQDEAAVPGTRVRVRFGRQLVDGWVLARVASSAHEGKLAYLEKVVSPEPVLSDEIAALARAVADRYAGSLADVLRLAVPPRHARVEKTASSASAEEALLPEDAGRGKVTPTLCSASAEEALPSEDAGRGKVTPTLCSASAEEAERAPGGAAAGASSAEAEQSVAGVGAGAAAAALSRGAGGASASSAEAEQSLAGVGAGAAAAALSRGAGGASASSAEAEQSVAGVGVTAATAVPSQRGGDGGASSAEAEQGVWARYRTGPAYLRALAGGKAPRAVWSALPGEDWPARIAEAVAATVASERGAVVVVPDARDLDRVDAALAATLGPGRHVALNAALGPAERYRRFLAARRGAVRVVVGTRAAMFAPVGRLGLVVIWDDGDDLHAEPRAPYPHAREVLLTRAQLAGAAALLGGFARSTEAQLLVETGWAHEVAADRTELRRHAPRVVAGDDSQLARDPGAATARLPSAAWSAARDALRDGDPVLVQVPRRGYLPAVSCDRCRAPARCAACAGPLELGGSHAVAACRWCGRVAGAFACTQCGGRKLRAAVIGARRTAEELGRAFPDVPVRTSGREEVLTHIGGGPALVVATPGAEPVAEGGYGAVLLLDTWALLTRAELRAGEEALRRWLTAAALARPGSGRVVVVADAAIAPVQALLRWDPAWYAARELADRRELGFPPAVRLASVTGVPAAVQDLAETARLPERAQLLGPVPAGEGQERLLVRVPRSDAAALAKALHEAAAVRSTRKAADPVRVRVDAPELA